MEIIIAIVVVLFIVLIMSVGLIQKKPIRGSCGGVSVALGEEAKPCGICGRKESCEGTENNSKIT